ncbi:MAG TPA: hypothetical protein DDW18_05250 [Firmicutes bacterium]|nr:hypothetical protein [Bacillota bacterium]HBN00474.1 hypothetical protein [Bacillota bacterium]
MKIPFEYQEKEIDVLGSRFIAVMMPLERFEEIDACLETVKDKYPKATHYPFAARYLPNEKASDDGEPSHSTGIPLLSLLQQKEIDHIFLCVVRYFGGTKLGLSRLTRTYREIAAHLLNEGTFAREISILMERISLSYSDFEYLKRKTKDLDVEIKDVEYDISVKLSLMGNAKILNSVLELFPNAQILNEKEMKIKRRIPND